MKLTWIQRLVLLILFSFLLSGCKGDMTDTGNETDIPDKNAVVTESMSEELPVEQTEESASVLVQDLGELLCERDSVRDLMLVVDRRGLDDITVMTSEEERERILDELYAADLSGFESAGPREAEVRTNTEDPLYSGTATVPESGYETKMNKLDRGVCPVFF